MTMAPQQHETECQPPTKGILSRLPASWVPYAELIRFHQPHGNYMIYFPHLVGLFYASSIQPTPVSILQHRAILYAIWTFFLRSAGCAWNDVVDQDYDRRTARCRNRPIARGAISTLPAVIYAHVLLGFGFVTLQGLPRECSIIALVTWILAIVYPFGKRFTYYPQVILGMTLASAVVQSASSVGLPVLSEPYTVPTLCLSGSIVLLVVFYDVVYARQDTADDLKTGVKGMAVRFRHHLEALFAALAGSVAVLLSIVGVRLGMGPLYYMFSVGGLTAGLVGVIALTHWNLVPSWSGFSGWLYAFAIANLVGGFFIETCVRAV